MGNNVDGVAAEEAGGFGEGNADDGVGEDLNAEIAGVEMEDEAVGLTVYGRCCACNVCTERLRAAANRKALQNCMGKVYSPRRIWLGEMGELRRNPTPASTDAA